jgi:XTP/dITP diphosphohydrolase
MPDSNEVWFATSNNHKFHEATIILERFNLRLKRLPTKGSELQADNVTTVAKFAAKAAYERWARPLIVEDTGLFVSSLKGFPGTYASFVARTLGPPSILKLLDDSVNRVAEFVTAVAFTDDGVRARVFSGKLKGVISKQTRGIGGFGFDSIFIPIGEVRTLAEMTQEEKSTLSHRSKALKSFGRWFERRPVG